MYAWKAQQLQRFQEQPSLLNLCTNNTKSNFVWRCKASLVTSWALQVMRGVWTHLLSTEGNGKDCRITCKQKWTGHWIGHWCMHCMQLESVKSCYLYADWWDCVAPKRQPSGVKNFILYHFNNCLLPANYICPPQICWGWVAAICKPLYWGARGPSRSEWIDYIRLKGKISFFYLGWTIDLNIFFCLNKMWLYEKECVSSS